MKNARRRTLPQGPAAGPTAGLAVGLAGATAVLSALVLAAGAAAVHDGAEGPAAQAAHASIDWPLHGAHDVRAQSAPAAVTVPIDWP
ncbi:hypothetical protein [Streptomyces erythrochromogenes]|uniref:hypothetical protein n=1 Tax=Streptomyces erythrochromogenes TaxID=285574 RepID=UPI00382F0897|nr:hypothetical protein OG489_29225 [Streptomyces erythrochromogenes]